MELLKTIVVTKEQGAVFISRWEEFDIDTNSMRQYVTLSTEEFGLFFVLEGGSEIYDFLTNLQIVAAGVI